MKKIFLILAALLCLDGVVRAQQFWHVDEGKNSITRNLKQGETHHDHIEMSGKKVSVVLRYGVAQYGSFELNKGMVWPMLRTIPNNTHASLMRRVEWNPLADMKVNGWPVREKVKSLTLNGTLEVTSEIPAGNNRHLSLKRIYFPSTELPSLVEIYEFRNTGSEPVFLEIPRSQTTASTDPAKGVDGSYRIICSSEQGVSATLQPGETVSFTASVSAYKTEKVNHIDGVKELEKRKSVVGQWLDNLVLETPDTVINEMFAFSKIRAMESIYETKCGPMHGPGGESYYAAIWANDQAEYINPYFPYVGYVYGNASALNSFRLFSLYMNKDWKPIPSSIIAEGDGYWNGAGDRGDAAMIAYGAARYALASGNRQEAAELWPLIEWCLEYCKRKINEGGVVASDADELEGRFPAGKANLCTSSLYYDALFSAAYLAEELGKGGRIVANYRRRAKEMEQAIDRYFAARVEGYDTYAYYKGNDVLRAWICIPLTVGINKRAVGTIDALFSPRLWTENGLLTAAGDKTFWDRSTLYALRGVFMTGETERAMDYMKRYSATRLLGAHVPYAVEAWPEGGQRHLSAESALYGRIVTEGIFGIRPTGLHSFSMIPRLPQEWGHMALRNIKAYGADFDIEVVRAAGGKLQVTVKKSGETIMQKQVKSGTTINCTL